MYWCFLALTCLQPGPAEGSGIQERWYFGTLGKLTYEFRITADVLDKTPAWSADREHPPLGARQAAAAADKLRESLLKDYPLDEKLYPKNRWGLDSIDLTPTGRPGRWIWVVRYECPPLRARDHAQEIRIPVLMDGTVVQPTIFRRNGEGPPRLTPVPE